LCVHFLKICAVHDLQGQGLAISIQVSVANTPGLGLNASSQLSNTATFDYLQPVISSSPTVTGSGRARAIPLFGL
jgi:hypothetical protein